LDFTFNCRVLPLADGLSAANSRQAVKRISGFQKFNKVFRIFLYAKNQFDRFILKLNYNLRAYQLLTAVKVSQNYFDFRNLVRNYYAKNKFGWLSLILYHNLTTSQLLTSVKLTE